MSKKSSISAKIAKQRVKKGATLAQVVEKVVDVLTKPKKRSPFGGKGGRKKKRPDTHIEEVFVSDEEQLETISRQKSEYGSTNPMNDFFYTHDKFIVQFEDAEIFQFIRKRYPDFMLNTSSEIKSRRSVLQFLDDETFVETIMRVYGMSIFDIFKFMFRIDLQIFSSQFTAKISDLIRSKRYYPK